MARFVGTKVEFGADKDELALNLDARELPLIHADTHLNDLLLKYCEAALAGRRGNVSQLRTRVENAISPLLANIIKELQESGHGRVAQSWVGTGPNEEIAPNDLANALGGDTLNTLSKHTGLSMNDLLAGLSQHLPDLVDQLTPKGRLPSEDEAARMV